MMTIEVSLTQERFEKFTRLAEEREKSAAELLEDLAEEFLETAQIRGTSHQTITEARTKFPGEFVAVHQGKIIAHHSKADVLLKTVEEQFDLASADVLLIKSEDFDLRIRLD